MFLFTVRERNGEKEQQNSGSTFWGSKEQGMISVAKVGALRGATNTSLSYLRPVNDSKTLSDDRCNQIRGGQYDPLGDRDLIWDTFGPKHRFIEVTEMST